MTVRSGLQKTIHELPEWEELSENYESMRFHK